MSEKAGMLPFLLTGLCSSHVYCIMQPFPEAGHVSRTFQADFDGMICRALEKYHPCPGFTLLLGGLLEYTNFKYRSALFPPGMVASLYLARQQGEGYILDDMGLSGIHTPNTRAYGTDEFLTYFIGFLETPERSGTYAFDQQRYVTAAKECLQLCLCSHHKFSKETTESAHHNKALLRNRPWAWKAQLGVYSRMRKAMRHLTVQQWKFLKARSTEGIHQHASFTQSSSEYEYYRFLSYQWALDLLPVLLEKCGTSLELADVLRTRTFTTMAPRFPRRMRLARDAITAYLLRVDSAIGGP